ncbi:RNase A-like domain-containing protein [Streptomyces sp. NPDC059917]|uniref:RNase A-like domain-containing protein n=1 Tax=Streptomyces sp. NPDC059917 TaxID=3347002 RepID=UPI00365E81CC
MAGPNAAGAPAGPAQPPGGPGSIDVKPSDLWRVSGHIAQQQGVMHTGAKNLITGLQKYPDAGGAGTDAARFSQAYMKTGNRWLEVWGKGVLSIGGAAVGFTETANAYSRADAAAHPKPGQAAETRPVPAVTDRTPDYGKVPDLKWGDHDGGDDFIRSVLEMIPETVRGILQPVLKKALRIGRLADVFPEPQQHYLNSLSQTWSNTTMCLGQVSGTLTAEVSTITNPQQADWENAMKTFCSAVWGTSAWGKTTAGYQWAHSSGHGPSAAPTGSQPVMTVLFDTAMEISNILREYAEAAVKLNHEIWEEFVKAAKQAAKEVLEDVDLKDGFGMKDIKGLAKGLGKAGKMLLDFDVQLVLKLDTAAINRIVDTYTHTLNGLTTRVDNKLPALDEAFLSAPKFEAGVARAHGFGARALNEFKHEQKWTVQDKDGNQAFDLAGNEYLGGGHTLDKHVGKTDEQLAQRLRDQSDPPTAAWPHNKPKIGGSSTFTDYAHAQSLTEYNLKNRRSEIQAWLTGPPPPAEGTNKDFTSAAPNGENSGRYVSKQPDPAHPGSGYKDNGLNAKAVDVKNVKTVLKYDSRLDPPYIIYTSMPAP